MEQELENTLFQIAHRMREVLQSNPHRAQNNLHFSDYHGFNKSYFPDDVLTEVLKPFGYKPEEVQVEIVKLDSDLRNQIHYHKESAALVSILGSSTHLPSPNQALAYRDGSWVSIQEGDEWLIPPMTPHGFTVQPGGLVYFLSVQYPPITFNNKDDYHSYALS